MGERAALAVGEQVTTASTRLIRAAAIEFAQEFDPQPMHLDDDEAAKSFFGALAASGWHALALTMRLAVEIRPFGNKPLIGAELNQIRFARPILPDSELVVRITFEAVERDKGRYDYNILRVKTLDAASGEVLIRQRWRMLCI